MICYLTNHFRLFDFNFILIVKILIIIKYNIPKHKSEDYKLSAVKYYFMKKQK